MKNIIIKYSIVFFSFLFLISGSLFAREYGAQNEA